MRKIRGKIFTAKNIFEYGEVTVEGKVISEVKLCNKDDLTKEEQEQRIIPGLVDIHMHGACGRDVCSCDDEGLRNIAEYERQNGVTSICLATMTLDEKTLIDICKKRSLYIKNINNEMLSNDFFSDIEGIYLEGPFIAEAKAGAQNPEHIRKPDINLYDELQKASGGLIKVVTIAPEVEGAIEFIKHVAGNTTKDKSDYQDVEQCIVSIAHTSALAYEAREAFVAGANQVTHLYNAMTQMSHREPGVPGEAADHEKVMVELICDGIHIDPVMVRNTYKLFGASRIILVSDSMEATGMPDGNYILGDQKVIKKGNRATLEDGTIAGSVTNLYECMRNVISYGIRVEDAVVTATVNPAKQIGIYDKVGSLEAGKIANILIMDNQFNLREVI